MFEILTVENMENTLSWVLTRCGLIAQTCFFQLQCMEASYSSQTLVILYQTLRRWSPISISLELRRLSLHIF